MRKRLLPLVGVLLFDVSSALAGDPFPEKVGPNVIEPRVQFGEFGNGAGQLNDPTALAISGANELYIAECFNNRVQVFNKDGKSIRMWSMAGDHQLKCPQGIAVDEQGFVFVAESTGKISIFKPEGTYVRTIGQYGYGLDQIASPTNIAVQRGRIYVADIAANRIQIIDNTGKAIRSVGTHGPGNGQFTRPRSVAVDSDDNIYAVDDLHRVQKFDADGHFVRSWGIYGGMPGELAEPSDIAVNRDRVYVADTTNHRLQGFDLDGNIRLVWGRHPEVAHEGNGKTHYPTSIKVSPDNTFAVACEQFEYRCQIFDVAGLRTLAAANTNAWWEKFPRFHYGGGARIARASMIEALSAHLSATGVKKSFPKEILVITEPDLHRVVAFGLNTPVNELSAKAVAENKTTVDIPVLYNIGSFGHGPGQFATLAGKSPTFAGTLLIADAGNNNIQEFDLLSGAYKRTLFGPGSGPSQFHGPSGIAETPEGEFFIGDFHNNRIQVFDKDFNYKRTFGELGSGEGQLFGPLSLSFDPKFERLYVTDTGNQRVVVFNKDGKFLFSFGHLTKPGEWGQGSFQWPFDVAVSQKGEVYVSDPSLQLVQKFDADGKFLLEWGGWGTQPGQFYKCKGIDVDEAGNVYVIDFGNHRGQAFDANGKFLGIFGEGVLYPPGHANQ